MFYGDAGHIVMRQCARSACGRDPPLYLSLKIVALEGHDMLFKNNNLDPSCLPDHVYHRTHELRAYDHNDQSHET